MWHPTLEEHLVSLRKLRRQRRKKSARKASGEQSGLTFRPVLHPLEDRTVPTGSVSLSAGVLTITGTAGNDTASVRQTAGTGSQPDKVVVILNGKSFDFKVTQINQIQARLLDGSDSITLDESDRRVT